MTDIVSRLYELRDSKYGDFLSRLIPTVPSERIIGVRTPDLRALAKELSKQPDITDFLDSLPHRYFEENQLHAFIVSMIKDYDKCVCETERFLPYVDNWATCDQMSPKVFKKNRGDLAKRCDKWILSGRTYTIRFGIRMLMDHFLDDDFDMCFPEKVADIRSEEYYVNMMIAWYFATALAKQYEAAIPYIENKRLDVWTHNKAIQKAIESLRITDGQKSYLKSLKIKGNA